MFRFLRRPHACLLFAAVAIITAFAGAARASERCDLIVVSEAEPWLAAVAAPVAAQLAVAGQPPLLLVVTKAPDEGATSFLRAISRDRAMVVVSSTHVAAACGGAALCGVQVVTGDSPLAATVIVAGRFWDPRTPVVAAGMADAREVILAAAYAAHHRLPLILYQAEDLAGRLGQAMSALRPSRIVAVVSKDNVASALEGGQVSRLETLTPAETSAALVRSIGVENVGNVILCRTPSERADVGRLTWLGPYQSLVRQAPLVLADTNDARVAEKEVLRLIRQCGLRPKSVTILADYASIGTIPMRDDAILVEYEVEIEPCSGSDLGQAASFGVGRIPLDTLHQASLLLARGRVKEQGLHLQPFRALMIANPNPGYGPLPLCETISRTTGEELKNWQVDLDEFYRRSPVSEADIEMVERAGLIIYQGHIFDFTLFSSPNTLRELPWEEGGEHEQLPEENEPRQDPADERIPHLAAGMSGGEVSLLRILAESIELYSGQVHPIGPDAATVPDGGSAPGSFETIPFDDAAPEPEAPLLPPPDAEVTEPAPVRQPERLDGMPLVVIQSCHSLQEQWAPRVLTLGGTGLLGTSTGVHSASGSAFVKAYVDGLLYGGMTQGEALRYARNYFLCLGRLRAERGHKQQAKAFRVAVSFRLWGDPDVPAMRLSRRHPRFAPVTARMIDRGTLEVSLPRRTLPEARTEEYLARSFPGSEMAGIVKSVKGVTQRRLMPLYFMAVPVDEAFLDRRPKGLVHPGDDSCRAVYLADAIGRVVYVLYFPEEVKKNETHTLRFTD